MTQSSRFVPLTPPPLRPPMPSNRRPNPGVSSIIYMWPLTVRWTSRINITPIQKLFNEWAAIVLGVFGSTTTMLSAGTPGRDRRKQSDCHESDDVTLWARRIHGPVSLQCSYVSSLHSSPITLVCTNNIAQICILAHRYSHISNISMMSSSALVRARKSASRERWTMDRCGQSSVWVRSKGSIHLWQPYWGSHILVKLLWIGC